MQSQASALLNNKRDHLYQKGPVTMLLVDGGGGNFHRDGLGTMPNTKFRPLK